MAVAGTVTVRLDPLEARDLARSCHVMRELLAALSDDPLPESLVLAQSKVIAGLERAGCDVGEPGCWAW